MHLRFCISSKNYSVWNRPSANEGWQKPSFPFSFFFYSVIHQICPTIKRRHNVITLCTSLFSILIQKDNLIIFCSDVTATNEDKWLNLKQYWSCGKKRRSSAEDIGVLTKYTMMWCQLALHVSLLLNTVDTFIFYLILFLHVHLYPRKYIL